MQLQFSQISLGPVIANVAQMIDEVRHDRCFHSVSTHGGGSLRVVRSAVCRTHIAQCPWFEADKLAPLYLG